MKVVRGYVHHNGSVGVLVRFVCGSDFTSRTPEFKEFTDNVCMAVATAVMDADAFELGVLDTDNMWCVHDDLSIPEYLKAASEVFREPITIEAWEMLTHDEEPDEA